MHFKDWGCDFLKEETRLSKKNETRLIKRRDVILSEEVGRDFSKRDVIFKG